MDETFFISDKDAEHVVKLENDEEEGNALFDRTDEVVPLKAEPTIAVTLATVSTVRGSLFFVFFTQFF